MKLLQAQFDQLVEQLGKQQFEYVPREEKEIDWSRYDRAQINEVNDMLCLIRASVDEAACRLGMLEKPKPQGPGRPPCDPVDVAKVVLMQQYFGVSNRVAEGLTLLFKEKLRLHETFSYKTIERGYGDPQVKKLLEQVFALTQEPVRDKETTFCPDGTGLPTSIKHNWENERGEEKNAKGFEKMIAMVGYKYKLFSAVAFPDNPFAHESPYFPELLEQTAECYDCIDGVPADSAYLSRNNCTLIAATGGTPRIYPKKNITLNSKGSPAWKNMLLDLVNNPQRWLRDYHTRSIAETSFSTFKRANTTPLRKRLKHRRKQEAYTRTCNYNLKRLCYLNYLEDISATKTWNT